MTRDLVENVGFLLLGASCGVALFAAFLVLGGFMPGPCIEKERCQCHYRPQSQITESHSGNPQSFKLDEDLEALGSALRKRPRGFHLGDHVPPAGYQLTRSF